MFGLFRAYDTISARWQCKWGSLYSVYIYIEWGREKEDNCNRQTGIGEPTNWIHYLLSVDQRENKRALVVSLRVLELGNQRWWGVASTLSPLFSHYIYMYRCSVCLYRYCVCGDGGLRTISNHPLLVPLFLSLTPLSIYKHIHVYIYMHMQIRYIYMMFTSIRGSAHISCTLLSTVPSAISYREPTTRERRPHQCYTHAKKDFAVCVYIYFCSYMYRVYRFYCRNNKVLSMKYVIRDWIIFVINFLWW